MKHRCDEKLPIWAVLMLVPTFLQAAKPPPPPQTFQLSQSCSITSSNFLAQIGNNTAFTKLYLTWRANWTSTGCTFPLYVLVNVDYFGVNREVVYKPTWDIEVTKDKFKAAGRVEQNMKGDVKGSSTKIVARIAFMRLTKIQLITKEQYDAEKKH